MTCQPRSGRFAHRTVWLIAPAWALAIAQAQANTLAVVDTLSGGSHFTVSRDDGLVSGTPGVPSQRSASSGGSATVFSAGSPFPPVGTQQGNANAFAQAQEGVLKASSSAGFTTAPLVQNSGSSRASATARWSDLVTVSAPPGLTGSRGTIAAEMRVGGGVGGGVSPGASFGSVARFLGTGLTPFAAYPNEVLSNCEGWALCQVAQQSGGASAISFSNMAPTVLVNIPVVFGQALSLDYTLDVTSLANAVTGDLGNTANGAGFSDFSHTLEWAGITGVFDSTGQRLAQYDLVSQSGFDYVAGISPVPLPPTLWCLVAGLGVLYLRKPAASADGPPA